GSAAHLLEPDLKEGSGGLRDVHTLGWAARALTDGGWVDGLVSLGALRPRERDALADAEEYLTRLRGALHVETGRKTDRLPLELQPALAEAMGFEDEPGLPAVDGLMRATFEHARQVEHAVRLAFDRLLSPGSAVRSGEAEPAEPLDGFEGILEALAQAAESGRALLPVELDRIEATDPGVAERWSPGMREGFLRLLRAGRDGTRMLEALDRAGLLVRLLPEWGPVRCRPQRDPYHRFTVDVHLLETSANARALLDRGATDDPVAVEAAGAVEEVDGLLLGALLHDVGKTGEGRHVPVGARVAAAALDRIGVVGRTRELARFLVEDHLLLSDTATRRDITDEDLVLGVAARVRDQERLAALYLLALADGRATGPHAWTPWRSGLVRELVAKVQRVLERGQMGDEAADRLAAREREIREALAGEPADAVELFLARLPRSYLLAVDAERAARHFGLLDSPLGLTEVRTLTGPGEGTGTHALAVVTRDRPGLLARIAGALALSGLSILSAQVFTTEDGVAVDLFEVEGAFEREVTEERWRSFRALLRKAVEDRVSLEHRVREKRSYYRPPRADIPLKVRVDNESSDFFTVVEVSAADRIGLLYDITQAFAELGLDVHLAKVATYGVRVVDAFYVRDALGERILHPARVGEIERAVAARLGPAEELEQG
ncbi:MAG: ACT domain-containing protein, partial [Actinobacteria bacterium]|nr:ACT domain-containing protein [Actinomycetota bacterium]